MAADTTDALPEEVVHLPTAEDLGRINPFSRHAKVQGRRHHARLKRQLFRAASTEDGGGLPDLGLRVRRLLELDATAQGLAALRESHARVRALAPEEADQTLLGCLTFLGELDEALHLARRQAMDAPQDDRLLWLLAVQLMIAGRPDEALDAYRKLAERLPDDSPMKAAVVEPLLHAGLARGASPFARPQARPEVRIFCVSLDRDIARRRSTRRFLEGSGEVTFVPGVLGSALPEEVVRRVVADPSPRLSRGEIGCSMSHWKIWDICAETLAEGDYAFVCEDDCRFLHGPGVGLAETIAAARAAGAPIVFVNEMACALASRRWGARLRLIPVDHPRLEALARRSAGQSGWGTDGYLLTRAGAEALRAAWAEVGIAGSVDWQMKLMSHASMEGIQSRPAIRSILQALQARGSWPKLQSFITTQPICTQRDYGYSTINAV